MSFGTEKEFLLNYGWKHFWCDPKYMSNVPIREFIKGPFRKPKLVCSIPFGTICQQDGTWVEITEGIPNCWTEYLAQNFRFFGKHSRFELMHKEDADIVPHLRKYRLYIGQGIPDPWTVYPHNSEFSNMKDTYHLQRFKNKKERCLCCEREFLFDCPDKFYSNANHCPCKDCHSKNPSASDSCEKCRCGEILHNWILENNRKKYRRRNSFPNGSHSETEDEYLNGMHKFVAFCECIRNRKGCECSGSENSGLGEGDHESKEKTFNGFCNKREKFLMEQPKVYFCPCIKNYYRRKSLESFEEPKTSVSKEIQAEIHPVKSSKMVQTENKPEKKAQPKCICNNKCFSCNSLCNNKYWVNSGGRALHPIPNFCCSSACTQRPAFVCPYYYFANHLNGKKHCNKDAAENKKRHKKKFFKDKDSDEGSNADSECRCDQYEARGNEYNLASKSKMKEEEHDRIESLGSLRYNKHINNSQTPSTTLDHLKFLAGYKLKGFIPDEEISAAISSNNTLHQSSNSGYKFNNYFRENSSLNNLRQESAPLERLKHFSHYNPRYSESSFAKSKMIQSKLNSYIGRFNYCNHATMTPVREAENMENCGLIKEGISKELIESDKFRAGGFLRNPEIIKTLRKRRTLLRNRKRRRKLVAPILQYQDPLTKKSNQTADAKKAILRIIGPEKI